MRPATLIEPGYVSGTFTYARALAAAAAAGTTWHRARAGEVFVIDDVLLRVLAPDSAWTAAQTNPNAACVVVRIEYHGASALLTGDADEAEERWMLARDAALVKADLLKVSHHGSHTGTSPDFLEAVAPSAALVSVAARNVYGHPAPMIMRRLTEAGASVLRTDQLGSVVASTDGAGWTLQAANIRWRLP